MKQILLSLVMFVVSVSALGGRIIDVSTQCPVGSSAFGIFTDMGMERLAIMSTSPDDGILCGLAYTENKEPIVTYKMTVKVADNSLNANYVIEKFGTEEFELTVKMTAENKVEFVGVSESHQALTPQMVALTKELNFSYEIKRQIRDLPKTYNFDMNKIFGDGN